MDYHALAALARPALITAATRQSTMTYKELKRAIGLDPKVPASHHLNRVLDLVSKECIAEGEPSLAVLVVARDSGEPGSGFTPGAKPWFAEAQQCFRFWKI